MAVDEVVGTNGVKKALRNSNQAQGAKVSHHHAHHHTIVSDHRTSIILLIPQELFSFNSLLASTILLRLLK